MKIKFETSACTRCGGTGRYSFNQIDGDKCYGCNGTTQALTRRGKAASKAYNDLVDELCTRTWGDISVGDTVWAYNGNGFMNLSKGWVKVTAITPDPLNPGRIGITTHKGPGTNTDPSFKVKTYDRETLVGIMRDIAHCYPGATIIE